MNRSLLSKTKYMIGVGLKILARSPLHKLVPPLSLSIYVNISIDILNDPTVFTLLK